jgi:hypothetical protein
MSETGCFAYIQLHVFCFYYSVYVCCSHLSRFDYIGYRLYVTIWLFPF